MNIVIGRGNARQKIELPCGIMLAQAAKQDPDAYRRGLDVIFGLVGIPLPDYRVRF